MELEDIMTCLFDRAQGTGKPAEERLSRGLRLRGKVDPDGTAHLLMFRYGTYPSEQEVRICALSASLKNWQLVSQESRGPWGCIHISGTRPLPPPEPILDPAQRAMLIQQILEAQISRDAYWAGARSAREPWLQGLKPSELLAEHQQYVRQPCQSTTR